MRGRRAGNRNPGSERFQAHFVAKRAQLSWEVKSALRVFVGETGRSSSEVERKRSREQRGELMERRRPRRNREGNVRRFVHLRRPRSRWSSSCAPNKVLSNPNPPLSSPPFFPSCRNHVTLQFPFSQSLAGYLPVRSVMSIPDDCLDLFVHLRFPRFALVHFPPDSHHRYDLSSSLPACPY